MRALFNYVTSIRTNDGRNYEETIKSVLKQINWWPAQAQDSPLVLEHKDSLLADVSQTDKDVVNREFRFTICDNYPSSRSWGIVSFPSASGVEYRRVKIRIKNENFEQLKASCERMAEDLNLVHELGADFCKFETYEGQRGNPLPDISILERRSEPPREVFRGTVLNTPLEKLRFALVSRSIERKVAFVSLGIAALLVLSTIPVLDNFWKSIVGEPWFHWLNGFLGRLATAAFFASIASFINILAFWSSLGNRDRVVIDWQPVMNNPRQIRSRN